MEEELQKIEEMMKSEISEIKEKYKKIKKEVKDNYKKDEKKPKRKSIPKTLKNDVWDKYIGREKGVGKCEVCSGEIECRSFHCGHVKSVKDGGDTIIENMRPICGACNTSMGTENLFEFKEKYYKEKKPVPVLNAAELLRPRLSMVSNGRFTYDAMRKSPQTLPLKDEVDKYAHLFFN